MAMNRVVTIPLGREPEVLFGLKISDLIWIAGAAAVDMAVWHGSRHVSPPAWGALGAASLTGLALATVRHSDVSLPQWIWRWGRFYLSSRLFLP